MLIDDVEIANIIMRKLIGFLTTDIDVYDFTNPDIAYEAMPMIKPDLIFLDLNMPWLNGWNYVERMKADGYSYKVIIVTSSTSYLDKDRCKEFSNIIDYFEKPVRKEALLKYIDMISVDHLIAELNVPA